VWTDSHCHVGFDGPADPAIVEASQAGVTRLVTVGTDAVTSRQVLDVARRHEHVYATIGLHPHEASQGTGEITSLLLNHRDPKVVGVGECGLDFYYEHSARPAQREAFAAQIGLARWLDLALVIHTRDAWEETFDILVGEALPERWIVHCFTGGPEEARRALHLGAYLSFSGIVTFKKATDVQAAARLCPMDRMLVETDTPYLAPVPHRGRPNRPAWVPLVGAAVASLKGIEPAEVARATWANATTAFRLPA
jgi:TatD DNase family protein